MSSRFPVDFGTVAVWKSFYGLHSDEELEAAESEWRYLLHLADVDDEYSDQINENSGINAASALAAIDAIQAQRLRYGVPKPAASLGWPRDWLDELKSRVRLEDLVMQHVHLQKRGKAYIGQCPFHQDRTPSFFVWTESQRFKCFGCEMSGDAFAWEQAISGLDFREAVLYLAAITDLDVPSGKRSRLRKGVMRFAS